MFRSNKLLLGDATKIHQWISPRSRKLNDRSSRRHLRIWALLLTSCGAPLTMSKNCVSAVPISPDRHGQHQRVQLRGSSLASNNDSAASTLPEQLHLAFADARGTRDVYAVSVSWLTWEDAKSQVLWGRDMDALGEVAVGNATRYTTHHTHLNLSEFTSGVLHSAVLDGLEPSSTFFYRVGDADLGWSTVRNFTTPGAVGAQQPLVLGILGDLGQTDDSRNTLDAVLGHQPSIDVVLHAGDLSYADCKQELWDSFLRMLDPAASHIPWMVAAGNHEIEAGTVKGGPFAAYEHRFRMPSVAPARTGLDCGVGGGLDGTRTACGPGLNDLSALDPATDAAATGGFDGERWGEAVLRARGAIDPFGGEAVSTGWPESGGGGEEAGGGTAAAAEKQMQRKCCPSEWSGTYDYGNSFYSFDVASVHVVVLNPYTATGEGSLQHTWLVECRWYEYVSPDLAMGGFPLGKEHDIFAEWLSVPVFGNKDLTASDRSLTPWLVAMFHCPWHNSNLKHPNERMAITAMRAMEPVLFEHNASLTISGHVHAYERSLPVLSERLNDDGLVNVVVGGSGNNEGIDPSYYRHPDWSAFRNGSVFGFGTLSVMNSTMALWEWKSNSEGPPVYDSTWISNKFSLDLD